MATFLASGADVLRSPSLNTLSGAGQDGAGQITVMGGTQIFSDQAIVQFTVNTVADNGELVNGSGITQIVVFASQADFDAGVAQYTYNPQNPGQTANLQNSLDRMGDSYLRFSAQPLISSDPGAPFLQELFVAPGSNIANLGTTTFDRNTDEDFNTDGSIDQTNTENGNGVFNVGAGQTPTPVCFTSGSYVQTPRGRVLIDTLRPGDLVSTMDDGPQPILWISNRHVGAAHLLMYPQLRPVWIGRGMWGAKRPTMVSQQHSVLVSPDLLMPAKKLVDMRHSQARIAQGVRKVTYIHLLFEKHQVIWVNGMASESLYPGPQCLKEFGRSKRSELFSVIPEIPLTGAIEATVQSYGNTARPIVRRIADAFPDLHAVA